MRVGFLILLLAVIYGSSYAQEGPAGVNLSSNNLWLSADYGVTVDASNGVEMWENRMGVANLNMIGVGANKPTYETGGINGLPTISFDVDLLESSGYLSPDYFPSVNEATIFIVTKADVLNQNSTLYGTYPLASNRFSAHLPWNSSYYFDFGTCCGGAQRLTDTYANVSAVAGTYYIWGATFNGSGRTAYLDNTAVKTTTLTGTLTDHSTKKFQIGGEGEDPHGMEGDIAEFILYNDDINEAQRIIINNYLSAKYNLTIASDYYTDATYTYDVIGIGTDDGTNKHSASGNGSSGLGLTESNSSLDAATEYLFAGHDNTTNSVSTTNLGTGVEERWEKDWSIEKTGTIDAQISFDFSEGINGLYPQNSDDYLLLRLNAGTYEDVGITNGNKSISGDKVIFDVSDTDLTNGYYTLGTADKTASPVFGKSLRTWYSYQSGNWNDPNTWTLDGGVTPIYDNASSEIPSADEVVNITTGRKVTIQSTTNNISITEIDVAGELDLTSSTGHDFNKITGNGVIISSAATDNFPAGDASEFADVAIGGTYRLDGGNITLDTDREFNNMEVVLGNTTDVATLVADYIINGTLTISNGILQINDNSNTAQVNLDLEDLQVDANGKITVGTASTIGTFSIGGGNLPTVGNYHAIYHRINIYGNLTNNGVIQLTNQVVPDYSELYSGGAASVYFKGNDHNSAVLNGQTDFYNLVVDKGSDQTYVLEINSSSNNNFNLFGANYASFNDTSPYTSDKPEVRKALWIKNGTLKLTGDIFIPTLTEGGNADGEYIVADNAALWVAGNNVEVRTTAITTDPEVATHTGVTDTSTDNDSFFLFGKLRISGGLFSTNNSRGVVYDATAFAEILIEGGTIDVSKFASTGTSGNASYTQSGGIVTLSGINTNGNFDFEGTGVVFIMSGGEIILDEGDFMVGSTPGNYSVTGGKVTYNMSTNAFINTTANLWDLELIAQSGTRTLTLETALIVSNDLTIGANTILDSDAANDFNLNIGADFTIDASGTYTANNNTTTLDGIKISNLNFGGLVTFSNFTIDKDDANQLVEIDNGAATAIQVDSDFRLEAGTLDYKSYVINAKGSVYLADTLGLAGQTGKLLLDGAAQQSLTSSGGVIANMEIDNTNGIDLVSGDMVIFETLTMTSGIFDINTSKLTMAGANAAISGTFSSSLMIQTAGNASDGGLEMYVDANETITYPVGTDANAVVRYTPLVATFSSFSDDGYVAVSMSDTQLPTTDATGGSILSYYWKVQHSDFTTLPKVSSHVFTHDASDEDGANVNPWVSGKVLDESPYTRSTENNYNKTTNEITFDGSGTPFDLENASYTAGQANRFNGTIDLYYSRQSGDFNTTSTWSKTLQDGTGTQEVPVAGSIVIIQNGDRVNVQAAIPTLGRVEFDHDYVATPSPTSEDVARLQFFIAGTFELGSVTGAGMVSFDAPDAPVVNGDFGDFGTNTDSYYLYFGGNATLNSIPTPIPNLMVESATYSIDQALSINYNLIIQGNGTLIPLQDITVAEDLFLGVWLGGVLEYPSTGSAITLDVGGDIDFNGDNGNASNPTSTRAVTVANSANSIDHKLILNGDIINTFSSGSDIDMYNGTSNPNVVLELTNESNNVLTSTVGAIPDLYRVVLNKGTTQTFTFSINNDINLLGSTNGATKALELQNGTLIINDTGIDIDLTTGGDDFSIPGTTSLQVTQGIVNVGGDDSGIALDGSLIIDGGTVDMDDIVNNGNNYIEYSASGNAEINISSGTLTVGSQIRRNTVATTGILNYTQTGGTVVVGKNAAPESDRGVFEILNTGSSMILTGGDFTIVRQNGTTPSIAALYLDPETSDFTGSTITIGNTDTPASQTEFNLNIAPTLNNIVFAGSNTPTSKVNIRALSVSGDITINSGHTLEASGFAINVAGNFTNNGTYTANGNTTTFNGTTTQSYSGSGSETFYNFVKNSSSALSIGKSINIANNLTLSAGSFSTGTNEVALEGDAEIDIDIISTSGNGLIFQGSAEQFLSRSAAGSNSIDILTIDNGLGVTIPNTGDAFTITDNLRLSAGKFNIGSNLLTLSGTCDIEEVNSFSDVNMIQTNSSFSDNGVLKQFPAISSSTSFTFPVGESIYTPAEFTITNMDQGSITIRPANEMHISIVEDAEAPDTEIVDADNALQYHWLINSSDIASLTGSVTFTYDASDALVTAPYTLINYIPAILLDASTTWDKGYGTANFDEVANTFTIDLSGADDASISGIYTAGVGVDNGDNPINGAIPDDITTHETNSTGGGNYDAGATWTTSIPAGGPIGGQIIVKSGDELVLNNNNVRLSRAVIESGATLTVDETTQHRLGTVTGTGTLNITSSTTNAIFPAGDYSDFFACSGGGLEYSGTGSYSVMSGLSSVRNLTLSDSGDRNLPNNDVTICEDLTINGPTLNNTNNRNVSVVDELILTSGTFNTGTGNIDIDGNMTVNGGLFDNETGGLIDIAGTLTINSGTFDAGTGGSVHLKGNISFTGGTFNGGSGTAAVRFNGGALQTIAGNFTGGNSFYRVEMYNDVSLSNSIEIDDQLLFSNGVMDANANTVTLGSSITVTPTEGTSTSYIDGKVLKTMTSVGDDFTFPIGKNGRWGHISVNDVSIAGETWEAEYFYASPLTNADVDNLTPTSAGILTVSNNEYWVISDGNVGSIGMTAKIGLSWDGGSDVSATSSEREQLEVMAWNDGASTWDNFGGGSFSGGHTQTEGSFISTSAINFSSNILTLGSTNLNNALPIELVYFEAISLNDAVELIWESAAEINNDFYTLYKSKDGKQFNELTHIIGAGNSESFIEYSFVDEKPYNGLSYYKLSQTDFDGTETDLGYVSVMMDNSEGEIKISSYPNPFRNEILNIRVTGLNEKEVVPVAIFDEFGRKYYINNHEADDAGYLDLMFDNTTNWRTGVYIITILGEKGPVQTKIIKL